MATAASGDWELLARDRIRVTTWCRSSFGHRLGEEGEQPRMLGGDNSLRVSEWRLGREVHSADQREQECPWEGHRDPL